MEILPMTEPHQSEVLIDDLKKLALHRDQQAIIAICVERDGTVRCVTYGEDAEKCKWAGWWGHGTLYANLSRHPFATIFGWGNKGIPTKDKLSKDEMKLINRLSGMEL